MVAKKKNKFDRVVAVDLGNGLIKIRSIYKDGKPYSLILPSAFALLKEVGHAMNSNALDIDTYTVDGINYVWGADITRIENFTTTYGHEGRYRTEAFQIMAKIVMARIARDLEIEAKEKILLVTGVPSIETNTEREVELANAFYGNDAGFHEIGVGDDEVVFRIAHVQVTSQALASVIGRYLAEDGTVQDEEYEKTKVAVVDIGAGTTDLDIVHELRRQKAYHSVPKGFRDVYDSIRSAIKAKYPSHQVTDYELLDAIENAKKKPKKVTAGSNEPQTVFEYSPSVRATPVDFTKALNDGIKEVAMGVQQAIMDKWKEQTDLDEILLVGGSADLFKEYMDRVMFGITIPNNNGDSNVEGYYRLGVQINEFGDE